MLDILCTSVNEMSNYGSRLAYSDLVSDQPAAPDLRPQSLLLTFLGDYVIDQPVMVASATFIYALGRTGISEAATRATLTRMTHRSLLRRVSQGREAYFGPTALGHDVIADGRNRVSEADVVTETWDGIWTTVAFTMPDSFHAQRHLLRRRLTWAGFGMLHSGLWVAPRRVDVRAALAGLDLGERITVFEGQPVGGDDPRDLVAEVYDLDLLRRGYSAFDRRWSRRVRGLDDPLARLLVLNTEWSLLLRHDPLLPVSLLPSDWPARRAQTVFRGLRESLQSGAQKSAHAIMRTIPDSDS